MAGCSDARLSDGGRGSGEILDSSELIDRVNEGAVGADGRPSPPKRLSPSGASTFEQCPRRWRFRYVERLPDPPGVDAVIGTFAHRVLELLMQQQSEQRTKDDAKRIARESWPEIEASDEFVDLDLDDKQGLDFRWRAWNAIEGLWDLEDPRDVEVYATEEQVTVELAGVPFRGVVDRIEVTADGMAVSDYKSGRAPSSRFAAARMHQVMLYAAAVAELSGQQPAYARLMYLGQRTIETAVTTVATDDAVAQLGATWTAISEACLQDAFEARPGPLCASCAYAPNCPEGQAETEKRAALRAEEEAFLLRLAG